MVVVGGVVVVVVVVVALVGVVAVVAVDEIMKFTLQFHYFNPYWSCSILMCWISTSEWQILEFKELRIMRWNIETRHGWRLRFSFETAIKPHDLVPFLGLEPMIWCPTSDLNPWSSALPRTWSLAKSSPLKHYRLPIYLLGYSKIFTNSANYVVNIFELLGPEMLSWVRLRRVDANIVSPPASHKTI